MVTQTVIFPKAYGARKARNWLRNHRLKFGKVDRKPKTIRFRQVDPSSCQRGSYATIDMGSTGIKKVICCPRQA